jgi:hypothetical protein
MTQSIMRLCTVSCRRKNAIIPIIVYLKTHFRIPQMHDEFLNQRHGTFFFIAILDGIFLLLLRYNKVRMISLIIKLPCAFHFINKIRQRKQLMSYNRFTMENLLLCQRMTLANKIFYLYIQFIHFQYTLLLGNFLFLYWNESGSFFLILNIQNGRFEFVKKFDTVGLYCAIN